MSKVYFTTIGPAVWCPACKNRHVFNDKATPTSKGASWSFDGNTESPTFHPSMNVQHGEPIEGKDQRRDDGWAYHTHCHSFVKKGNWEYLPDCAHSLAGQTVPVPDFPQYS